MNLIPHISAMRLTFQGCEHHETSMIAEIAQLLANGHSPVSTWIEADTFALEGKY